MKLLKLYIIKNITNLEHDTLSLFYITLLQFGNSAIANVLRPFTHGT